MKHALRWVLAVAAFVLINEVVIHFGAMLLPHEVVYNAKPYDALSAAGKYACVFFVATLLSVSAAVIAAPGKNWRLTLVIFSIPAVILLWMGYGSTSVLGGLSGIFVSCVKTHFHPPSFQSHTSV